MYRAAACGLLITSTAIGALQAQPATDPAALKLLERVGEAVQQYYSRAQHLMSIEKVRLGTYDSKMSLSGPMRELVYEQRLEWNPDADRNAQANVVRQLLKTNGRKPREGDEPKCMDPRPASPEPLAMLLPTRQHEFAFKLAGSARVDGRQALMLDYKSKAVESPLVTWDDECVSVELRGQTGGRIWVDGETAEVIRLDEHLSGLVEINVPKKHQASWNAKSVVLERADFSVRYKRVRFSDPEELLLLPASMETMTFWRNIGTPRIRLSQTFSDYRRFLTGGRVLP
jgi:hypothetical protein